MKPWLLLLGAVGCGGSTFSSTNPPDAAVDPSSDSGLMGEIVAAPLDATSAEAEAGAEASADVTSTVAPDGCIDRYIVCIYTTTRSAQCPAENIIYELAPGPCPCDPTCACLGMGVLKNVASICDGAYEGCTDTPQGAVIDCAGPS